MENETSQPMEESAKETEKSSLKKSKDFKTKLNLTLPEDHPFSFLQTELKRRGLKHLDLNELLSEVFEQIPAKWWEDKLDEMTPLEYKVSQALADPQMRKKFNELLT